MATAHRERGGRLVRIHPAPQRAIPARHAAARTRYPARQSRRGDGFTRDADDVAIDLGEMSRAYADVAPDARRTLIRRLLAHEYTHLLLHRWLDSTGWSEASVADDPFLQALRTLAKEGIANYRSIEEERWVAADGQLTPHARETLATLHRRVGRSLRRSGASRSLLAVAVGSARSRGQSALR